MTRTLCRPSAGLRLRHAVVALGLALCSLPAHALAQAPPAVSPADIIAHFDNSAAVNNANRPWLSWTPSGTDILATLDTADGPRLSLVGVSGVRDLGPALSGKLSPDGRFVAAITPDFQLRVSRLSPNGLETVVETALSTVVEDNAIARLKPEVSIEWSPQSRLLAVTVTRTGDRSKYPADIRGVTVQTTDVDVFDIVGAERRTVFSGPGGVFDLQWGEGGKRLVFAYASDLPWATPVRVVTMRPDGGDESTLKVLARPYAPYNIARPTVSTDGRYLSFNGDRVSGPSSVLDISHFVLDRQTGVERLLPDSHRLAASQRATWDDSKGVFLFACRDGVLIDSLCRYRPGAKTMQRQIVGSNLEMIARYALSQDGGKVAVQTQDALGVKRLYVCVTLSCRVLWTGPSGFADRATGKARVIRWKAHDGLEGRGLLIEPVGAKGRRAPLLVDIHGGPSGGVYLKGSLTYDSPLEWQLWAGLGFAVLVPEYRQSGRLGVSLDHLRRAPGRPWLEGSLDDVMSGVDAVIAQGIADPDRLAVIGMSWGGVLTNSLVTRTDRFKVAISNEGAINQTRPAGEPAEQHANRRWMFNTTEAELPGLLAENSPLNHADKIHTPLLSMRGVESPTGVDEARTFTDAIVKGGGKAELLVLQGEGHGFTQRSSIQRVLCESLRFVGENLPNAAAATAARRCRQLAN